MHATDDPVESVSGEDRRQTAESATAPQGADATRKPRSRRRQVGELTGAQTTERDRISTLLHERHEGLDTAIETYNQQVEELRGSVQQALDDLNEALSEARDLRDDIVAEIGEYIEGRSEKWRESEKGEAMESFKSAWEYAEMDEVSVEFPERMEIPDMDPDILDNLPEEAEAF